ncbi:MAG: hypothetical protein WD768_09605 [Phycisphaeraceae bacterium]
MMRFSTPVLALVMIVLARPALALSEEALAAAKQFDSLFGESIKQVTNTVDPADDIALAKKLVEAAASVSDKPDLLAVMLEKAYDLCAKDPSGTATAIQAMEVMADRLPEKRASANQRIIILLTRDYSRARTAADQQTNGQALIDRMSESAEAHFNANDYLTAVADYRKALPIAVRIKSPSDAIIRSRIETIGHRQRTESQISSLQARILENRNDVAGATELVTLLTIEMDRPAATVSYIDILTDEDLKKHVTLASKSADELTDADFLYLGTWYEGQAKKASSVAKRRTLERAASYLKSFLDSSPQDELVKLQAELALKRVQSSIKELSPEPVAPKDSEKVFVFTGKPITIEAEKAQVIGAPMKIERTPGASGGAFVWSPAKIGERNDTGGGHVVFHVKVEEATDAYFWGKIKAPAEENNSFYLAVTPGKETTGNRQRWDLPNDARNWTWATVADTRGRDRGPGGFPGRRGFDPRDQNTRDPEPMKIRLEAGINSIIVSPREAGAMLDTISLSKTPEKPR